MKIVATLRRYPRAGTADMVGAGTISADEPRIGPARCYADADGATAAQHGNPTEDPTRPFGDHPFGLYAVVSVRWSSTDEERRVYGPVRLGLDPQAGQAYEAKRNGRVGLAIHGGPTREGALRATHGCLRVDDDTAVALAAAVDAELAAGRPVSYLCEEIA